MRSLKSSHRRQKQLKQERRKLHRMSDHRNQRKPGQRQRRLLKPRRKQGLQNRRRFPEIRRQPENTKTILLLTVRHLQTLHGRYRLLLQKRIWRSWLI